MLTDNCLGLQTSPHAWSANRQQKESDHSRWKVAGLINKGN